MKKTIQLNQNNLPLLPSQLEPPTYDRDEIKTGIVHIGVGGFHRAHQAFYTDALFRNHDSQEWGFCGIALLPHDKRIYETLSHQNGLYTLMVRQGDGSLKARVIGSIKEILFAPENPQKVIQKMAAKEIKLITMTITEGGYNFDAGTGEFAFNNPDVQWDLKHPSEPKTVFGYLSQSLKLRKEKGLPVTILSCDNIQHNGHIAKKMILSFIKAQEPGLADWVTQNVSFPNCMVDRITPVTKPEDIADLAQTFGVKDGWPVVSEAFHQWIIEDRFKAGRPNWEKEGVQFVDDVQAYEEMKLRILNAGHSLVGLTGTLAGYQYIDEAVKNADIHRLIMDYFTREVIPVMNPVKGVDLNQYKDSVVQRFGNAYIKDTVLRIISESAAKLPKFILPTVLGNLKKHSTTQRAALVIAAWFCYLKKQISLGKQDEIQDQSKEMLIPAVKSGPEGLIALPSIFGTLSTHHAFMETYLQMVSAIEKDGILETIRSLA